MANYPIANGQAKFTVPNYKQVNLSAVPFGYKVNLFESKDETGDGAASKNITFGTETTKVYYVKGEGVLNVQFKVYDGATGTDLAANELTGTVLYRIQDALSRDVSYKSITMDGTSAVAQFSNLPMIPQNPVEGEELGTPTVYIQLQTLPTGYVLHDSNLDVLSTKLDDRTGAEDTKTITFMLDKLEERTVTFNEWGLDSDLPINTGTAEVI